MFASLTDDFVLRVRGYFDDEAHPVIPVQLRGRRGAIEVILAIDTGFDDDIYVPVYTAIALGLPLGRVGFIEMIDGSIRKEFIFEAECQMGDLPLRNVHFVHRRLRLTVNVYIATSEDGLIGAGMFQGMKLEIDYEHRTVALAPSRSG